MSKKIKLYVSTGKVVSKVEDVIEIEMTQQKKKSKRFHYIKIAKEIKA